MAANGISTLSTKEARQDAKLALAGAKRKGRVITEGSGAWSDDGTDNVNAKYYRQGNTLDKTLLANPWEGNSYNVDDDESTGAPVRGRPWLGASIPIDSNILDDAFVYVDAGSTASYPGTGTAWNDISGNNLNATLVGAPPFVAGANAHFTLAGGDHATLPTGFANDFANGFGLFAIWNFGTASNYERIIDLGQGAQDDNIIVGRKDTSDTFFYQLYDGATQGTFVEVPNSIQNSQFASYGVAINGQDGKLYVNGALAGTHSPYTDIPTNVSRNSNFIGKSNWGSDGVGTGAMGVVIIFKRALSITEFQSLHNSFASKYGLTAV